MSCAAACAAQVREGGLATAEGVSYLEAKHLLLAHYCSCILAYLALKAEGRAVQAHPVIGRLVEIRAYLVGGAVVVFAGGAGWEVASDLWSRGKDRSWGWL
jgi:hypothetical protein